MKLIKPLPNLCAVLFILLFTTSCTIFQSDDSVNIPEVETIFTGIFEQGIEDSVFRPCLNQSEKWQLIDNENSNFPELLSQVDSFPAFVEVKGTASKKGRYKGIFMEYDRNLNVTEFIAVSKLEPYACK